MPKSHHAAPEHRDKLDELLFDEGRRLVNIKLFPGQNPHASSQEVRDAAAQMIEDALADPQHTPPMSGRARTKLDTFVA